MYGSLRSMMKSVLQCALFAVALSCASPVYAAGQATPDEAKALAIKAADYLRTAGPDKAFAEFDAKDGTWHDRDLYVYVLDNTGVMVAHGNSPGLIGKSLLEFKDVDGKPITQDSLAVKDAGWVDYKWQNPLTKALEPKVAYIVRVGEYAVVVGAYK
jgi:cytochrome c